MFTTWKYDDIQFIGVANDVGVHVIDEIGNNYGSWRSARQFRAVQKSRDPTARPLTGQMKASLRIHLSNPL